MMTPREYRHALVRAGGVAVTALALAGCTTARIGEEVKVKSAPEPADTPTELVKALVLDVRCTAAGVARPLGEQLVQAVNGKLAEQGYVCRPSEPDVVVSLDVSCTEFDRSGSFVRYDGRVQGSVTQQADGKLLSSETVAVTGERALGGEKAMASLRAALTTRTVEWVTRSCGPTRIPLVASEFTVKRAYLTGAQPAFVEAFVRCVGAMKGVVSCRLVREDHDQRIFTFRVLHQRDAYPQGILNAIILAHGKELGLGR
jgi:hypothetical protein